MATKLLKIPKYINLCEQPLIALNILRNIVGVVQNPIFFHCRIFMLPQRGKTTIKHRKKNMHIIKQCIEKIIHRSNQKYMMNNTIKTIT